MADVEPGYALKIQCAECPWRRDIPTGRFGPERFARLASACQQGFNPVFACHKTQEGKEQACVGFLLLNGKNNFLVRMASIRREIVWDELQARGPLYDNFRDMAVANGYDPGDDKDFR